MNALIVINDAPYGSERPYNALRIAVALSTHGLTEGQLVDGARGGVLRLIGRRRQRPSPRAR